MDKRKELIRIASGYVGKREEKGNAGRFVAWLMASVGLGDRNPWCAGFVRKMLDLAGFKSDLPRSGRVYDWKVWAVRNKRTIKLHEVEPGDLFLWVNSDKTGHIGIVTNRTGGRIMTIEGNTNKNGSREGDSVQFKDRTVTDNFVFIRLM